MSDGSYEARGAKVYRKPISNLTTASMGFMVCDVSHLDETAAKIIAAALNEHRAAHPKVHD